MRPGHLLDELTREELSIEQPLVLQLAVLGHLHGKTAKEVAETILHYVVENCYEDGDLAAGMLGPRRVY